MAATQAALSEAEITLAITLLAELHRSGRQEEEALMRKLMKQASPELAELLDDEAWSEDDLTDEDKEAIEIGLAQIAAGKVVPHEVVMQGPEAVADYRRRRDAGEVNPLSA
jgi:predicted transcriptional regulator